MTQIRLPSLPKEPINASCMAPNVHDHNVYEFKHVITSFQQVSIGCLLYNAQMEYFVYLVHSVADYKSIYRYYTTISLFKGQIKQRANQTKK